MKLGPWVCGAVFAALGCQSSSGTPPTQGEADWERVSGDVYTPCFSGEVCTWANVGDSLVQDFVFDGDDVVLLLKGKFSPTGTMTGSPTRISMTTGTGTAKSKFDENIGNPKWIDRHPDGVLIKGDGQGTVALYGRDWSYKTMYGGEGGSSADSRFGGMAAAPDGLIALSGGDGPIDPAGVNLVDPAASTARYLALEGFSATFNASVAFDDAGNLGYVLGPSFLGIVAPATGALTKVPVALNVILSGHAPGGGFLGYRIDANNEDEIIRLDAGGATPLGKIKGGGAIFSERRLIARDGYLYVGANGLWRSKTRLF